MAIMYNRPMTKEEEERMMMAQSLKNNNMMMADNNTVIREPEYPADYTTGPTLIPPDADMSQFNDVTESMQQLPMDSVAPMAPPMTPEQIDEEIMRLQILKNQMMMGN